MRKKARKSKKSSVARGRKRDAKGHFVKARRKRARAREDWRGQPRRHAKAARLGHRRRRRAVRRVAAPRKRARRVTRPVTRRRRRSTASRRPIVIRVGAPAREAAAETPKPRRRRRATRENPWYGEPRRHARAARLGWRRRGHTTRRRRRAAPRTRTRTVIRTIHKRVGGRPIVINLRVPTGGSRGRRKTRRHARRTPTSHRLPAHMPESPYMQSSGEYTLENPLSAGELAFVVGTAGVGWIAAEFVGRWLSTTAVTSPNGSTSNMVNGIPVGATQANDVVTLIMPGWKSMLGQAVLIVAVGAGSASKYAHAPMLKASLQGAMIGVGLHLFADIARPLLANLFKNTALGQRFWLAELEAREAGALTTAVAATDTITNSGTGTFSNGVAQVLQSPAAGMTGGTALAGLPRGVGRPAQLAAPVAQFRDPGPQAQPRGVGQAMSIRGPLPPLQNPFQQQAQQNLYQQSQQLAQIAAQQAAAQAAAQQAAVTAYGPGDQLPPAVSVQQQQQGQIAPPPGFPVTVASGSACAQASQGATAEIAGNAVSGLSGLNSAMMFPD